MSSRPSQRKNVSLQLVTFMAAVSGIIFHSAIAVQAMSPSLIDDSAIAQDINSLGITAHQNNLVKQRQLVAQVWLEIDTGQLSLATSPQAPEGSETTGYTNHPVLKPLNQQQQQ
ncbi:MAG: hypothetical protein AAFN00_18925, partial [Cyanobacteria bacterium J06558_2]